MPRMYSNDRVCTLDELEKDMRMLALKTENSKTIRFNPYIKSKPTPPPQTRKLTTFERLYLRYTLPRITLSNGSPRLPRSDIFNFKSIHPKELPRIQSLPDMQMTMP